MGIPQGRIRVRPIATLPAATRGGDVGTETAQSGVALVGFHRWTTPPPAQPPRERLARF
jgi:hypothetical protein